jgi:hypothetical protein
VPFEPLSLSLGEAVQRAMDGLPAETSNGSKNRLFLRFMGELLKQASAVWDTQTVTYEWFSEALVHFDDIIANVVQESLDGQGETVDSATQLQLFYDW